MTGPGPSYTARARLQRSLWFRIAIATTYVGQAMHIVREFAISRISET